MANTSKKKYEWVATYTLSNGDTHMVSNKLFADTMSEASALTEGFVNRTLANRGNPENLHVVSASFAIKPPVGRRPGSKNKCKIL